MLVIVFKKFIKIFFLFFSDNSVADDIGRLRMKPDDFILIQIIGRGAFGEVQLVINCIFYVFAWNNFS